MIGITEYTVAGIYDYIHRHEDRAFVLKFSAMEIYNEAVRDLLSTDSLPLRVVDDPEASARTDIKVQLGAWSWDTVSGEEFRVGAGLAKPYPITWPQACCHHLATSLLSSMAMKRYITDINKTYMIRLKA